MKNKTLILQVQYCFYVLLIFVLSNCNTREIPPAQQKKAVLDTVKTTKKLVITLDTTILSYVVNLQEQQLKFYWKDETGSLFSNIGKLKKELENKGEQLVFATNGGMFSPTHEPVGLYIENGKTIYPINTVKDAYGNFYLQPNGIFYIQNDKKAVVVATKDFEHDTTIQYATQSGPMLVIDGKIHSKFNTTSEHTNIRNGVGILPNGNVLLAMSKQPITLYDFATYFKQEGCENALYLDGAISQTYLPSQDWMQTGGNFGVLIAVIK